MSLTQKLEATGKYKPNSIKSYKKNLKVLGLVDPLERDLKGNILNLIKKIKDGNYKNDKVYYNSLKLVYKLSNYDEIEMTILNKELEKANTKSDKERKEKKIEYNPERFKYNLSDVQKIRDEMKEIFNKSRKPEDLVNWLLASLYSDNEFGPKRMVDIMNLKWEHFDHDNKQIKFTSEKNGFKYTSKELSDDIFNPLEILFYLKLNKEYILTTKKNEPFGRQNIGKRFKQVFKDLPELNGQNIRTLWASEKYSKSNKIKDVLEQAFELTHTIQAHYASYLSPTEE